MACETIGSSVTVTDHIVFYLTLNNLNISPYPKYMSCCFFLFILANFILSFSFFTLFSLSDTR